MNASGGEGELLYKFAYIHDDETVVLQDFSSKKNVKFELEDEGTYKFIVYVTDETGTTVSKTIKKFKVKTKPLSMTEFKANKLNAVVSGSTVKLLAETDGGAGEIEYKFTYKSIISTKSTVIKKYGKSATAKWTPDTTGIYKLTAYAKDSDGTVVKQSFYFVVL